MSFCSSQDNGVNRESCLSKQSDGGMSSGIMGQAEACPSNKSDGGMSFCSSQDHGVNRESCPSSGRNKRQDAASTLTPEACLSPSESCILNSLFSPKRFSLRHAAFTLLELAVSTAIVAILSLILLQIVSRMLDATRAEVGRMDAYANGRNVLSLMARDISQTVVEQSTNANRTEGSWTGIPPGTEFNWRSIYVRFNTNALYHLDNQESEIIFSGVIPVTRGQATAGLRVVGYGLSNGFLIRYQSILEEDPANDTDNTATSAGLYAASGVTTDTFIVTNYLAATAKADIIAENVYWVKLSGPTTDAATNRLPGSITMTLRAAQGDIIARARNIEAAGGTLTNLLFMTNALSSVDNPITVPSVREITLTIPLQ